MIPISATNSRIFGLKIDFLTFAWAEGGHFSATLWQTFAMSFGTKDTPVVNTPTGYYVAPTHDKTSRNRYLRVLELRRLNQNQISSL